MEKTYKLFEQDTRTGKLYPLFIGKKEETLIDVWVHAEHIPTKGFSVRSGWHCGFIPDAPWLKAFDGSYKSQRGKNFKRVWCECECNLENDYTAQAQAMPKKCFERVPDNGYYFFREVGNRIWVITSDIKITRIITEEERQRVLSDMGYDEAKAFEKYYNAMKKRLDKKREGV